MRGRIKNKELNDVLRLRLRELREARGITQRRLADMMETNQQNISRCEIGVVRMSAKFMAQAAEAMGYPASVFYDDIAGVDDGERQIRRAIAQLGPVETVSQRSARRIIRALPSLSGAELSLVKDLVERLAQGTQAA